MKITTSTLSRLAGLSAVAAGVIFAGIQPIHPPDVLSSATTSAWGIIMPLKLIMCLLFLVGITGIYTRQVKETGWLGLVGFLMLSLSWALNLAFIFAEAFIVPLLATTAPTYVDGFFGIFNGQPVETSLGTLPALYALTGLLYMLGGLLFGMLAVVSALTPAAALFPHELQRLVGMPVGLALAWLGYALWSEWRAAAAESMPDMGNPQLAK